MYTDQIVKFSVCSKVAKSIMHTLHYDLNPVIINERNKKTPKSVNLPFTDLHESQLHSIFMMGTIIFINLIIHPLNLISR